MTHNEQLVYDLLTTPLGHDILFLAFIVAVCLYLLGREIID